MKTRITGKHLEISPEIKTFIEDTLSKLEKYEDSILNSSVIIEHNDKRYRVEVEVHVKKHVFSASDESYDLTTSIDDAVNKVKKQLIKFEEKIHEHKNGRK